VELNFLAIDKFTLSFIDLAVALSFTVLLGILARLLKQPLIIAYIVSGILISVFNLSKTGVQDFLPLFATLGITFLLFLVGLELRISDLKSVGKASVFTGLGQIIFTFVIGLFIILGLGFSFIEAVYISIALTFSSTIIVIKLLTEKKDLNSLYGKITVGFLLIQDFAAILALIFIASLDPSTGGLPGPLTLLTLVVKGLILFGATLLLNKTILPRLFKLTSSSGELLFLAAISWAFIFAGFAKLIGFSLEIGAFLAGVALASSPFHLQISSKVRPLRDFFIITFFLALGANIHVSDIFSQILPTILLSLFILVGNPLIVMLIMGFLGYRKRTSFLASVTVAQISEFSLIVVAAGQRVGHLSNEILSVVALIGIVTITVSSYMILYSNFLYKKLSGFLGFFERKEVKEAGIVKHELKNHIILIGCEQVGKDVLETLGKHDVDRKSIVIVDFNPEVTKNLEADNYQAVYGDVADYELLEELNIPNARMIISTIPDFEDNKALIHFAKEKSFEGAIVATAYWKHEAIGLYEIGASYVLVPELVGGKHLSRLVIDHLSSPKALKELGEKNFKELSEKK